ncbi:MAG: hypothetical protein K0Q68_2722 [Moraxellaceae bacterium]|jgi:hypothetical protein|nr:hypothetical protein [Moraxellaceae bacterium]
MPNNHYVPDYTDQCIKVNEPWDTVRLLTHAMVDDQHINFISFKGGVENLRYRLTDTFFKNPYQINSSTAPNKYALLIRHACEIYFEMEEGKTTLSKLLSFIADHHPRLKQDFIENCTKCIFAVGTLRIKKKIRNTTDFEIAISEHSKERSQLRQYASSMADELFTLSEKVGKLIKHNPTTGSHRETILRSLLSRQLPHRFHVATGFIFNCPRQIDILIYDRLEYSPIFIEGDLVVVPAESVRAAIEVKTTLTTESLEDALSLMDEISWADDLKPPFFKGIYAFKQNISKDSLPKLIVDFYADPVDGEINEKIILSPYRHLSALCVGNTEFMMIEYKELKTSRDLTILSPHLMRYKNIYGRNVCTSIFFDYLLRHLTTHPLKEKTTSLLTEILLKESLFHATPIYKENWGPYQRIHDFVFDVDFTEDDIRDEIHAIQNWINTGKWPSKNN